MIIRTAISILTRAALAAPLVLLVACSETPSVPQSGLTVDFSDSLMSRQLPDSVSSQVEPRATVSYSGQSVSANVSRVSGSLWNVNFDVPPGIGYTIELSWFWNNLEVARISRSLGAVSTNVVQELTINDSDYDTTFNQDNDPSTNYQELVNGTNPDDPNSFGTEQPTPPEVIPPGGGTNPPADLARISFATDLYTMGEGESLTIPIERRDITSGISTVRVTIEGGSASLNSDVIRGGGRDPGDFNAVFEFVDGVSQLDNMVVQAVDDDLVEDDESFFVTLTDFSQAVGGSFTRVQVNIISDDDFVDVVDPPVVSLCGTSGSGSDLGLDGNSTFDWSDNCTLRMGGLYENSGYTLGIQNLLYCLGFTDTELSGVFSTGTELAVIGYQGSRGLTADGIVGGQTWAQLQSELVLESDNGFYQTHIISNDALIDAGVCVSGVIPVFDWAIDGRRWEFQVRGTDDLTSSEWTNFSVDTPYNLY